MIIDVYYFEPGTQKDKVIEKMKKDYETDYVMRRYFNALYDGIEKYGEPDVEHYAEMISEWAVTVTDFINGLISETEFMKIFVKLAKDLVMLNNYTVDIPSEIYYMNVISPMIKIMINRASEHVEQKVGRYIAGDGNATDLVKEPFSKLLLIDDIPNTFAHWGSTPLHYYTTFEPVHPPETEKLYELISTGISFVSHVPQKIKIQNYYNMLKNSGVSLKRILRDIGMKEVKIIVETSENPYMTLAELIVTNYISKLSPLLVDYYESEKMLGEYEFYEIHDVISNAIREAVSFSPSKRFSQKEAVLYIQNKKDKEVSY